MSGLTASSLLPLFSALPEEEQHAFAEKIEKILKKRDSPVRQKKTKRAYETLDPKFWPENRESLVTEIMHGII